MRILGSGIDGMGKVVYPVDMQCRLQCPPDLIKLWETVKVPKDPNDIEQELAAAGMKVCLSLYVYNVLLGIANEDDARSFQVTGDINKRRISSSIRK